MRIVPVALLALLPVLLGGCSDPPPGQVVAISASATRQAVPQGPSFADWNGRLDQLLTPALAAQIAQRPIEQAEVRTLGDALRYRWPSTRTGEYAGVKIPKKDVIGLSGLRRDVTPESFHDRFFAEVTDEQRRALDEQVRVQAAKRGLDAGQTAMTQGLAASLLEKDPAEAVPGLGDAAAWVIGKHGQNLYLLHNGSLITIEVDLGDDAERNRTAAVELARQLLARL